MGLFNECVAEALGIFLIIVFGTGSVAVSSDHYYGISAGDPMLKNLYINFCWGLAVTAGIFASFDVSGAQLNPAVTITVTVLNKFPVKKCIFYIIAQLIGAGIGAVMVSLNFVTFKGQAAPDFLFNFYCTAPHHSVNLGNAFFNEMFATALLVLCVFALTNKCAPFNKYTVSGFVGATVFLIGNVFGPLTGYALNPARDLAPRIVYQIWRAGYDIYAPPRTTSYFVEVWGSGGYGLWVPIIGPIVGGILGGAFYKYAIKLPDVEENGKSASESKDLELAN